MKTNRWLNLMLASMVVVFAAVAFNGCSSEKAGGTSEKSARYTCPMHTEVVKDKPGDCPKCGMKLVEKK